MNISFLKLGEEECERCDLHDKHLEENIHKVDKHELSKLDENGKNRKPTFVNCADCVDCVDFELHIKITTEASERYCEEKNQEWTDNKKVVSVDM